MARRRFTAEFKRSAIGLVIEQKYTLAEAAERLGIGKTTLEYWLKRHRQGQGSVSAAEEKDLRKRVAELEKENQSLRLEREILKKAAAFFAKEQP
jgi:transposase